MSEYTQKRTMTVADAERVMQIAGDPYIKEVNDWGQTLMLEARDGLLPPLHTENHISNLAWSRYLLDCTHHSLRMLTGSDYLPTTLQKSFRSMLGRLMRGGGDVHVIVADGKDDAFRELQNEFPGTLHVQNAWTKDPLHPLQHYMTSDTRRARREKPHMPIAPDAPASTIESEIYVRNTAITHVLDTTFAAQWRCLTGEALDPKTPKRWWQKIL